MFRVVILAAVVFSFGLGCAVRAQDAMAGKAQEIASALDKTKYKKKDKPNFSIEIYIDVKNEPVLKGTAAEYAGEYASDDSDRCLSLSVAPNGEVTGIGRDTSPFDDARSLNFTLHDARIDGAVLSAVKVYENGETRKFQAVFVNRTVSAGKNASDIETSNISYGLGFLEGGSPAISGVTAAGDKTWTNRVFLARQ